MQHLRPIEAISIQNSFITIGSFDGVHLGHQAIIRELVADAHVAHALSVVISFHPHPAVVLGRITRGSYLTSPDERAVLLADLGVDIIVTLTFTRRLANLSAAEFMRRLTEHLGMRQVNVGYDFALGRNREGNVARLKQLGSQFGYALKVIQPVNGENGAPISSSRIRQLISEGKMDLASKLLGRYYCTDGLVVHGDRRGKQLGFPTANLEVWSERLMPPAGVYATRTWIDGECYPSVANLGVRPTFENQPVSPVLEVHVMDWKQDIYGETIQVDFIKLLRPEVRFPSVDALIAQINADIQIAKEVVSNAPCP